MWKSSLEPRVCSRFTVLASCFLAHCTCERSECGPATSHLAHVVRSWQSRQLPRCNPRPKYGIGGLVDCGGPWRTLMYSNCMEHIAIDSFHASSAVFRIDLQPAGLVYKQTRETCKPDMRPGCLPWKRSNELTLAGIAGGASRWTRKADGKAERKQADWSREGEYRETCERSRTGAGRQMHLPSEPSVRSSLPFTRLSACRTYCQLHRVQS
jgi:hypothetical protein